MTTPLSTPFSVGAEGHEDVATMEDVVAAAVATVVTAADNVAVLAAIHVAGVDAGERQGP
jgi:hypothetical protein